MTRLIDLNYLRPSVRLLVIVLSACGGGGAGRGETSQMMSEKKRDLFSADCTLNRFNSLCASVNMCTKFYTKLNVHKFWS
jgi:hypothetical protein